MVHEGHVSTEDAALARSVSVPPLRKPLPILAPHAADQAMATVKDTPVIRLTLEQMITPDHLLGRVAAVNAIFIGSSNEIGAFESGTAAKLLGTVPSVVLGGLATLGVVAVTAAKVPELRRLREIRPV